MRDIVIKGKDIRREFRVFLGCIVAMEAVNMYAIAKYDGQWMELLKSIGFVLVSAIVTYMVLAVIRLIVKGIVRVVKKQ